MSIEDFEQNTLRGVEQKDLDNTLSRAKLVIDSEGFIPESTAEISDAIYLNENRSNPTTVGSQIMRIFKRQKDVGDYQLGARTVRSFTTRLIGYRRSALTNLTMLQELSGTLDLSDERLTLDKVLTEDNVDKMQTEGLAPLVQFVDLKTALRTREIPPEKQANPFNKAYDPTHSVYKQRLVWTMSEMSVGQLRDQAASAGVNEEERYRYWHQILNEAMAVDLARPLIKKALNI